MRGRDQREAELRDRVTALDPAGRRLLAARLGELAGATGAQRPGRLVACIVTPGGRVSRSQEWREFARTALPDHLVPQDFVVVDKLPRTPAGKLDRRALARMNFSLSDGDPDDTGFVAPRNDAEQTLAGIWAAVLGLDEVGVHDNFFEIGGDSLLSIRILARANRAGLAISPDEFFSRPTVAEQAALAGAPGPGGETGASGEPAAGLPARARASGLDAEELARVSRMIGDIDRAPD